MSESDAPEVRAPRLRKVEAQPQEVFNEDIELDRCVLDEQDGDRLDELGWPEEYRLAFPFEDLPRPSLMHDVWELRFNLPQHIEYSLPRSTEPSPFLRRHAREVEVPAEAPEGQEPARVFRVLEVLQARCWGEENAYWAFKVRFEVELPGRVSVQWWVMRFRRVQTWLPPPAPPQRDGPREQPEDPDENPDRERTPRQARRPVAERRPAQARVRALQLPGVRVRALQSPGLEGGAEPPDASGAFH